MRYATGYRIGVTEHGMDPGNGPCRDPMVSHHHAHVLHTLQMVTYESLGAFDYNLVLMDELIVELNRDISAVCSTLELVSVPDGGRIRRWVHVFIDRPIDVDEGVIRFEEYPERGCPGWVYISVEHPSDHIEIGYNGLTCVGGVEKQSSAATVLHPECLEFVGAIPDPGAGYAYAIIHIESLFEIVV